MKFNMKLDKKNMKNLMILAILVAAVGAPVVYFTLDKIILKDQDGITVTDDSDSEFQYAWSQEFTLLANQKVTIIFTGSYTNITSNLKIFTKSEYDLSLIHI